MKSNRTLIYEIEMR